MFKLVVSTLAALALATSAEAACKKSTAGHNWDMIVYGSTGCTGTYEEFYGTLPFAPETDAGCKCFNIAAKLNDKVKSFSFTANGRSVNIFKDADCKGTLLGDSAGSWQHDTVSTAGQAMSSFEVCAYPL